MFSCDPSNKDPKKGLVYNVQYGNFRNNGSAVATLGFYETGKNNCYSTDSQDKFFTKATDPNNFAACCPQVESYDTIENFSFSKDDGSKNWAMILGIVAGVVILLVLIIVFFAMYKKGKKGRSSYMRRRYWNF